MGSKSPELNLAADYSHSQGVHELRCAALRSGRSHPAFPRGLRGIHHERLEGLRDHLPTKSHSESSGSARSVLRTPQSRPRAQMHCPALASRALPALGESGSPLTAPTKRHWKSFRTSSQLRTPSLRVDPTKARRRRQHQPTRQVGASIICVLVTPFPVVEPPLPARPVRRLWKRLGSRTSQETQSHSGRSGTALGRRLHLRALSFLPRSPEVETPEF